MNCKFLAYSPVIEHMQGVCHFQKCILSLILMGHLVKTNIHTDPSFSYITSILQICPVGHHTLPIATCWLQLNHLWFTSIINPILKYAAHCFVF